MAVDKTKPNGFKDTIWEKNDIPPLEYCSLARAARLLGCEVDDLWHWQNIGAIRFAVDIGKEVSMSGAVFPPEGDENSYHIETDADMARLIGSASIYLGGYKKGFDFRVTNNPFISEGNINFQGTCSGVFDFELTIDRKLPRQWAEKNFVRVAENDFVDLFIRVAGMKDLEATEDSLLITRAYVEEIHNAKNNGFYLCSTNHINHSVASPVRITSYQSDMIASLLRIIGFSEDEVQNLPAEQLNTKLSQMAAVKGVRISNPDKNTWSKWRERFLR
ncbi:hypothetical protein NGI10_14760 [Raoultella ornithinolytica]|uniref:hypothetical protein n=1 Tax=Raoultella ornithinolytica TaxID=54291 RepID=UPI002DBD2786|nr:hypothetical protein [Raoultella ornithinolytica]MEB8214404.1 hypothetical protein [Raoultella ornithinolytica]